MAYITIQTGPESGRRIEIAEEHVTLGRASDNTVATNDPAASSHHGTIIRDGRRYTLRDLNSTNGTLLNGEPIEEARLKPGDVFSIGEVDIRFDGDDVEVEDEAADAEPAPVVRASSMAESARRAGPSLFETRRRRGGLWVALAVGVALGLLALTAFFVKSLFPL